MAFDGITIKALVNEMKDRIENGYIRKISQPEKEELILLIRGNDKSYRLLISANASLPLLYLTEENKVSPPTAPNFCMLLRKHINGGRITSIEQIGNERVLRFAVEHKNELGDPAKKYLYVEIMGKHSNIIFCDENDVILDGIKHISFGTSSVREILPGRDYFIPAQEGKIDPFSVSLSDFDEGIRAAHMKLNNTLMRSYIGISKTTANEAACRAGLDADFNTDAFSADDRKKLYESFTALINEVDTLNTSYIVYDRKNHSPIEFAPYRLSIYEDCECEEYASISAALFNYYDSKNRHTNIKQRSMDLRRIVANLLERNQKKYLLQQKQMEDTDKMELYRTYGMLLQAFPHEVASGVGSVTLNNYETGEDLTIPLDETKSAIDNSKRFFDKYAKLKRTRDALRVQLDETRIAIFHLASIQNSLLIAQDEEDLSEIRLELFQNGYIRKQGDPKAKKTKRSKPLHYVTADGFDIYVGKNNFQNDELTFKVARGSDWWFHAKQTPGSHVIIKTEGRRLPDEVFETAARLAGYYSSARDSEKLEIDYVQKKHIKKPPRAVPGYVIYHTNYSMTIRPGIDDGLKEV